MAAQKGKQKTTPSVAQKKKYIDPIYKKYTERIIKTLASTEFYEFFIENMDHGVNEFQFSNRKLEKSVDEKWVIAIEECIQPFQNIIMNPRNYIIEEEEIVNVAVAKHSTPDVIRHLTTHGALIDEVSDDNVRPNRLMTKFKEDSWNTYENRFVFTLLEKTIDFVNKRYEAIFANIGDEYGAFLKMHSETANFTEKVKADIDIRIRENEDTLAADGKHEDIFSRIARLHRILGTFGQSTFAKQMIKYPRVKNPVVRTNAIQKNPNFKACYKLWVFIWNYFDIGYKINVYEQSNEITPSFQRDIYHSIMFSYIILKNYLENPEDREIDMNRSYKRRKLQPKYITQIVEEIVKNYDLPDVEIRKVLIEEITKAQLMKEEAEERRRLVEAKEKEMAEKRKAEEKEKARIKKEQEQEKARIAREKEKERLRKEKEAKLEAERKQKEKERKEALDIRRTERFIAELAQFELDRVAMVDYLTKQEEAERARLEKLRLEEEARKERERLAELARLEKIRLAEEARIAKEKKLAEEKAEKARLAAEARAEKQRLAAEAKAKAKAERERLAAEAKAERERLAAEAKAEKARLAEEARIAREKKQAEEAAAKEARRLELEKARAERQKEQEALKAQKAREAEERRIRKEQEAAAKEARRIQQEQKRIEELKAESQRLDALIAEEQRKAEEVKAQEEERIRKAEAAAAARARREKALEEVRQRRLEQEAEIKARRDKETENRRAQEEERRVQREKEAEERRVQREKEAEERRVLREKEMEERRVLREKEMEERRLQREKEEEERRLQREKEGQSITSKIKDTISSLWK